MKMTHELSEVTAMLAYLQTYSRDPEYQNNIEILYDYISDLVTMTTEAQNTSKKATELLFQHMFPANNRQNRRKIHKVIKDKELPDFEVKMPDTNNDEDLEKIKEYQKELQRLEEFKNEK